MSHHSGVCTLSSIAAIKYARHKYITKTSQMIDVNMLVVFVELFSELFI